MIRLGSRVTCTTRTGRHHTGTITRLGRRGVHARLDHHPGKVDYPFPWGRVREHHEPLERPEEAPQP
jgi:hypothetical protein